MFAFLFMSLIYSTNMALIVAHSMFLHYIVLV